MTITIINTYRSRPAWWWAQSWPGRPIPWPFERSTSAHNLSFVCSCMCVSCYCLFMLFLLYRVLLTKHIGTWCMFETRGTIRSSNSFFRRLLRRPSTTATTTTTNTTTITTITTTTTTNNNNNNTTTTSKGSWLRSRVYERDLSLELRFGRFETVIVIIMIIITIIHNSYYHYIICTYIYIYIYVSGFGCPWAGS